MFKHSMSFILLLTALLTVGCAVNLAERSEQGYGIIVFPDDRGTALWDGPEQGDTWGSNVTGVGGGYAAAALKPGEYRLAAVYNRAERGIFGSGHKDLDYGDRARGGRQLAPEDVKSSLGLALVKRMPIKQEREERRSGPNGEDYSRTWVIDVSSEYKMTLPVSGQAPVVNLKAGEVLLLPAFHADLLLDERSCTRKGMIKTGYVQSPLSHNPEDFEILEWLCPVDKLAISKIPARIEDVRAGADPEKLQPELMQRIEARDLSVRDLFLGARIVTPEASGKILHVYMEP